MIKRLFFFLLIILALFYAISGIYFYNKSFRMKNVNVSTSPIIIAKYNPSDLVVLKELHFDFEEETKESKLKISSGVSYSGKMSIKVTPNAEYGAEIVQSFSEIPDLNQVRQVEVTLKIFNKEVHEGVFWVLEVNEEDGKVVLWSPDDLPTTINKWETCSFRYDINPKDLKNFNRIKTYAWNKYKNTFYIDDVRVRFLGIQQEKKNTHLNSLNQTSFLFDLENDSSLEKTESLSEKISHSGKRSSFMNGNNESSVSVCKTLKNIMNDTISTVSASVWLYPLSDSPECTLVFEVRDSTDKQIYVDGKNTKAMNLKTGVWQKLNAFFKIEPEVFRKFRAGDRFNLYVLNNSWTKLYADDFEISYGNIPEQRGMQVFVDMNSLESRVYQFNRYHPPFPVSYLYEQNIHNNNSHFLIDTDTIHYGDLKPDQFMTSGNFTGNSKNYDELLVITGSSIELFHYCEKNRFVYSGSVLFDPKDLAEARFISGDFNGDGKDEWMVTIGEKSTLYNFTASTKHNCLDNLQRLKITKLWTGTLNFSYSKILSGKFSGNKNNELLLSNEEGQCIVKKFTGVNWITLAEDSVSKFIFSKQSTQVCGKYFTNRHDAILSVYNEKNIAKCALFELEGSSLRMKKIPDQEMADNIFTSDDVLYSIHLKGKIFDDILLFKNQWRFELKIISNDAKGFFVSSIPEFTGFTGDQNPKYYEFPKIVTGRFTGQETQMLCVLRNCADKNFDGKHCKEFDSIPDLPNTVQLYNFSR